MFVRYHTARPGTDEQFRTMLRRRDYTQAAKIADMAIAQAGSLARMGNGIREHDVYDALFNGVAAYFLSGDAREAQRKLSLADLLVRQSGIDLRREERLHWSERLRQGSPRSLEGLLYPTPPDHYFVRLPRKAAYGTLYACAEDLARYAREYDRSLRMAEHGAILGRMWRSDMPKLRSGMDARERAAGIIAYIRRELAPRYLHATQADRETAENGDAAQGEKTAGTAAKNSTAKTGARKPRRSSVQW